VQPVRPQVAAKVDHVRAALPLENGCAGTQGHAMKNLTMIALLVVGGCMSQAPYDSPPALPAEIAAEPVEGCPPQGWDRARLEGLKAAEFEIADAAARDAFARAVTACLASPDPWLRDGVAFEALTHMLRGRQLGDDTMRALLIDLMARLKRDERVYSPGFGQSFAALVLSEVARADRIQPYLTEDELVKLLVEAQHWFINIKDYRGFSEVDGWRHAVAHGSDLLMQLALNPRIDAEGLRLIVSAVGVQVAPESHAYVHGESERLMRPILFAAQRGAMSEAEWTAWLAGLATPEDPDKVFSTEAGLAWRHNTMGLLLSLYANVALSTDPATKVLLPGLETALKEMP
jgi:hypothetical protein